MVLTYCSIEDFINLACNLPVLDVRSESEFRHATFPGAVNIPVLNDEQRAIVGTVYKHEGNEAAVIKGYELTGRLFASYIQQASAIFPKKEIVVFCWRGGLRSHIMGFILKSAGFKIHLLQGGYKAYRTWVLHTLDKAQNILIVGGKTGSGKTKILHALEKLNAQVIDLEKLASHRGSAFGGVGLPEQPGLEMFENLLAMEWNSLDKTKPVWLENESRLIGKIKIPNAIFEAMRKADTYEVNTSKTDRIKNILDEYGCYDKAILETNTRKLEKKLGNMHMNIALEYLKTGQLEKWVEVLLTYYDKTYAYGKSLRDPNGIIEINKQHLTDEEVATMLIELALKKYGANIINTIQ